ncbi:MAG: N-acetyl-gamma-glutamyl-phosphate reductase [Actinobacteria bacterium]|nr:MAG: N-acetyl-gamma-glutamyl-phosphate reductase [Actinomycetota bacterium]
MIRAAVVGASGYSGAEIVRLLKHHKQVEVLSATSKCYANKHIQELYPNIAADIIFEGYDATKIKAKCDVVFTALPHGVSKKFVPELLEGGLKVIDLSQDYRIDNNEAVYGLCELNKDKIEQASLIANPGCYPTSIILALAPALKYQMAGNIVVNSLSGLSGAGASAEYSFAKYQANVSAYKVGNVHQHIAEMEQELSKLSEDDTKLTFTPHLIPVSRGIYSTVVADLAKDYSKEELVDHYKSFYQDAYFVNILDEQYPELKAVLGSNYCHIGLEVDEKGGKVFIMSVIDNLVKGAAGQAIQNMNIMFGLNEWEGLEALGVYP